MTPDTCPNCGADLPRRARACPECGACDRTGWSAEAATAGLDLPDESFDYDDFVKREFGGEGGVAAVKPRGIRWGWWLVALLLLVGLLLGWLL